MFKITPLDGKSSEESLVIKEGFTIGNSEADLCVQDAATKASNLKVISNSEGLLILVADKSSAGFHVGDEQLFSATLFPGMMLSIAKKHFIIEEFDQTENIDFSENKKLSILDAFSELATKTPPNSRPVTLLSKTARFQFVRGALLNTTWEITHCPLSFGSTSDVFFFLDETLETDKDFLTLSISSGGKLLLSTMPTQSVLLNNTPLKSQNVISDGDLVEFGNTAFYIHL